MIHQHNCSLLPVVLLFGLMVFVPEIQGNEDHQRDVLGKCLAQLNETGSNCLSVLDSHSDLCVKRIEEALKRGQIERALAIAQYCEKQLMRRANKCVDDIQVLKLHCDSVLNGTEWGKKFEVAADAMIVSVEMERDVAIKEVFEALKR